MSSFITRRFGAFTLIELLIVVAIIAILAAIAVPNFLEAQTRAKISRVRADHRTIDTGLQTYFLDNNQYPWNNIQGWALTLGVTGTNMKPTLERLTTPVAYLAGGSSFTDPFKGKQQINGPQLGQYNPISSPPTGDATRMYRYIARGQRDTMIWDQGGNQDQKAVFFALESCGTDGNYHRMGDALNVAQSAARIAFFNNRVIYNATNGTVSNGSIWRASGKGGRGDFFVDLVQSNY